MQVIQLHPPKPTPPPSVAAFLAAHPDPAAWTTADCETVEHLIETAPAANVTICPECSQPYSGSSHTCRPRAVASDDIIWPHNPARRPLSSFERPDVRRQIARAQNL